MSTPGLTLSQQRILTTVRREGEHTYNGRAHQAIAALEKLGLVVVDWDADLDHTKGRLRWHITVKPAPEDTQETRQAAAQAKIDALQAEADKLTRERDRIHKRLVEISDIITTSARWVGGENGKWVAREVPAAIPQPGDAHGMVLVPGYNVDKVDIAAGIDLAVSFGYNSAEHRAVVEYALMRHRRGEEEGAQKSALNGGISLTSWYAILAAALAAGEKS